jgi:hypothetical protein
MPRHPACRPATRQAPPAARRGPARPHFRVAGHAGWRGGHGACRVAGRAWGMPGGGAAGRHAGWWGMGHAGRRGGHAGRWDGMPGGGAACRAAGGSGRRVDGPACRAAGRPMPGGGAGPCRAVGGLAGRRGGALHRMRTSKRTDARTRARTQRLTKVGRPSHAHTHTHAHSHICTHARHGRMRMHARTSHRCRARNTPGRSTTPWTGRRRWPCCPTSQEARSRLVCRGRGGRGGCLVFRVSACTCAHACLLAWQHTRQHLRACACLHELLLQPRAAARAQGTQSGPPSGSGSASSRRRGASRPRRAAAPPRPSTTPFPPRMGSPAELWRTSPWPTCSSSRAGRCTGTPSSGGPTR